MSKLLILAVIGIAVFKLIVGRWPWEKHRSAREQALLRARSLLGVEVNASRDQIMAGHRRIAGMVHPDKGGSNAQMHEANDARDLLLGQLPNNPSAPAP